VCVCVCVFIWCIIEYTSAIKILRQFLPVIDADEIYAESPVVIQCLLVIHPSVIHSRDEYAIEVSADSENEIFPTDHNRSSLS